MPDYIGEDGSFTDNLRADLPTLLGDDYYNDPETKQQPTKELDNVKDLSTLLRKTVNASRKISAHGEAIKKATEGMIKIPGEGATPEEVVAYRKAQGVPETPDGYALTIPENDKEGFEAIAKEVKAAAHEAGIAPSKLAGVWEKVTTALMAQTQALEKKGMEILNADIQALKDAKKEKYDAFIQDTNKVASHFDVKADGQDNPIGSNFMKLMETMGIKDTPVVREFLGAIAPLVLEKGSHLGGPAPQGNKEGGFSYQYDEHGKPI
jgi:hypothetical protein